MPSLCLANKSTNRYNGCRWNPAVSFRLRLGFARVKPPRAVRVREPDERDRDNFTDASGRAPNRDARPYLEGGIMDFEGLRKHLEGIEDEDARNDALAFVDAMHDENEAAKAYREETENSMKQMTEERQSMENDYKSQISALKAKNYDLLMQVPGEPPADPVSNDVLDTGEVVHLTDIFDFGNEGKDNGN